MTYYMIADLVSYRTVGWGDDDGVAVLLDRLGEHITGRQEARCTVAEHLAAWDAAGRPEGAIADGTLSISEELDPGDAGAALYQVVREHTAVSTWHYYRYNGTYNLYAESTDDAPVRGVGDPFLSVWVDEEDGLWTVGATWPDEEESPVTLSPCERSGITAEDVAAFIREQITAAAPDDEADEGEDTDVYGVADVINRAASDLATADVMF